MTSLGVGARERRRVARAAPPPLESSREGVIGTLLLAAFASVCLWMYLRVEWAVWLVIAAPATSLLVIIVAIWLYDRALLLLVWLRLTRHGVRCIVIHSRSPLWSGHIAAEWLPRFGSAAVTLDVTDRARWQPGLAVEALRRFCGPRRAAPTVLVFRGCRRPYVFRFTHAFREARRGRLSYLQSLEKQMFRALELE